MGISNSKCHTWIRAGFSHWVTQSCESKTRGFSSTCGFTGTWKYFQVLSILNRNKVVDCKHKYRWNKILLRHHVTRDGTKYGSIGHALLTINLLSSSHSHSHPTSKTL